MGLQSHLERKSPIYGALLRSTGIYAREGLKYSVLFFPVGLFTLLLTACSTDSSNLDSQIVVWHSWQGAEEQALLKMLDEFRQLHPEVGIAIDFYPEDEIEEAYRVQVEAGLGPDFR